MAPSPLRDSWLGRLARAARHPPLWMRWLLTLLTFAVLIAAVWVFARSGGGAPGRELSVEVEANREGQIAIAEDQAPHTSRLRLGSSAGAALKRAIVADVHNRIAHGALTGPLQSVRCTPAGPLAAGRRPFRCSVRSAGIEYPFLGVVNERARLLTWCKRDPPPTSNAPLNVPLSSRCLA